MNYEKKYNEALEWMREMYPCLTDSLREDAEHYFPELRESEDERIRKRLIEYFEGFKMGNAEARWEGLIVQEVLAWLEKQKEQKPAEWSEDTIPVRFEEEDGEKYPVVDYKLMGQKPAEKQDYSGLNDLERAIHRGFLCAGMENVPVTIIKETAQECLAQMKPAELSEEDEKIRKALVWHLKADVDFVSNGVTKAECLAYLDKQKAQKQEWSEEDKRILKGIIGLVDHNQHYNVSNKEMLEWLKSLRLSWKPSEEQMEAPRNVPPIEGIRKPL